MEDEIKAVESVLAELRIASAATPEERKRMYGQIGGKLLIETLEVRTGRLVVAAWKLL